MKMSKDNQPNRGEYEDRSRRGDDEVDPWFGRTATDVTDGLHPPVPKHCGHPRLVHAPDPCYNRTSSDVTAQFQSRLNSPLPDCYYGRQETDVTAHLQVPVPKFVNPHGCASGKRYAQEELQTPEEAHSYNQRVFDYMHPLGVHRPFPLSDYYYHSGSKPSTPCGSRSQSPCSRPQSQSPSPGALIQSPSKSPRPRSCSPENRSRPRSCSLSLAGGEVRDSSRSPSPCGGVGDGSGSPSPGGGEVIVRSCSPSPELYASYDHLNPQHSIPSRYGKCRNKCQLCPPCPDCKNAGRGHMLKEFRWNSVQNARW